MRILIADDNPLVRRGVAGLLSSQEDCSVCGEVGDGTSAVEKARELVPDVILLDISMPGLNGLEAASAIRREVPQAKIVILSQHDAAHMLPTALNAGADACVDKSRVAVELLPAIRKLRMA
jgi:DNA-binding NarL/FixJ family response regulator